MSKITKLIKTPKSFMIDAIKNHINSIEYNDIILSSKKMQNSENVSIETIFNDNLEDTTNNNLENINNNFETDDFLLLKEYYDTIRNKNTIIENANLQNSLLSDDFIYFLLLSIKKFNTHHHHIFNEKLMTNFLASELPIKEEIIEKLSLSSKKVDNLIITNYIDYLYNKNTINSYSDVFKKIVNFSEEIIANHPYRTMLLGEDNLTELNATSINPQLCDFYISNYMLHALIGSESLNLNLLKNKNELYWWWLTYFLPVKNLNSNFIPIEIISYFKDISFIQNDLRIGLPKFFHKIYETNEFYRNRYNILNSIDFLAFLMDCYLNNLNNPINSIFINEHVESILEKKIHTHTQTGQTYSILDLICYISYTSDFYLKNINEDMLEFSKQSFIQGLPTHTRSKLFNNLITENKGKIKSKGKIRLIGLYHSYTGLGSNLKMMSNTLKCMNIPHEIYDVETKKVYSIDVDEIYSIQKNCNIFMINADMIPPHILNSPQDKNTVNIGFLLWELEEVPHTHFLALNFLDTIWVPTSYLENIYKNKTKTSVVCIKKNIDLIAPTKKYNPSKKFRFYMSFDFHSNIERKNPLAAVLAFKKAFSKNDPVEFILKTTDIIRHHPGNHKQQWENIIKETSNDSRFRILSGKIPFQDLVNQINNVECIVSSHRSEGFGYLPAHAFILGKPVITTDYSGTTDFCNIETSYPTNWHKKSLDKGDFGETLTQGFWADVDIDDLANNMLDVYTDYSKALNKAAAGKKLIESEYSFEKFSQNCFKELTKLNILDTK